MWKRCGGDLRCLATGGEARHFPPMPIARSAFEPARHFHLPRCRPRSSLGNSIVWNCGRALKYQEIFAQGDFSRDITTHTGMQLSLLWSAAQDCLAARQ